MLDFALTSKEGLVGNVKLEGSCRDHGMAELQTPGEMSVAHIKHPALHFRRADSPGSCLPECCGMRTGGKRGPENQGLPPPVQEQ